MGTKMGPSYANLFVGHIENQLLNQYNGPKPELFGRYIDDCFGTASCTKDELNQFITFVKVFALGIFVLSEYLPKMSQ